MKGVQVDVDRVISNEMKRVALNIATSSKAALMFPGLIMGLPKHNEVDIPQPDEHIEHPIDDTFDHSLVKREQRVHQYHFSDDEGGPSTGAFDFSGFQTFMQEQQRHNQYVRDQNTYLINQNEAIYRSNQGIHQDLYNAQMYPGNPDYPVMTPKMYQAYVHWPEGRLGPYVGAAADDEATEDDAGVTGVGDVDLDMDDAGFDQ
jgi:hypothetical protein